MVAVFYPCHIAGGRMIFNLTPYDEDRVKLVAMRLGYDGDRGYYVWFVAALETQKVHTSNESQILNIINLRPSMLGITHTGDGIEVDNIEALALWNNSTEPVSIDKSLILNLTLSDT